MGKKVQIVQNSAARYVLKKPRSTMVRPLIAECKRLSINQLIAYHSMLLMFKMVRNDYPLNLLHRYMYWPDDTLSTEVRTRMITQISWGQRSVTWWNSLPGWLRVEQNPSRFNKSLCQWMLNNIAMFVGGEGGDNNNDN